MSIQLPTDALLGVFVILDLIFCLILMRRIHWNLMGKVGEA
ncbi:hypothetical protein HanXRQr2_Chr11g0502281 [Helianthus annuus]|uniref:Uncharacterized protein n=1 Tax=Helianthus annuus TaxID=4232 RepID=A0A9K3HQT7_HELAN|nr:hypothetical protein HanXRQr2_Chr11g0502281 [Helianthus annuus]KAJ0876051.1 hypothetical protein HanPSC8_Chr11g0483951 [Helianthus annuus]